MRQLFPYTETSHSLIATLRESRVNLPVRVNGHCMMPWVRDGATVRLSAPTVFYWPGDVVVVCTGHGRFALHRVIGCYRRAGEWRFVTQGDRAVKPDAAVPGERILGRIAGGECSPTVVRIPPRHRLWAGARFVVYAIRLTLQRKLEHAFR